MYFLHAIHSASYHITKQPTNMGEHSKHWNHVTQSPALVSSIYLPGIQIKQNTFASTGNISNTPLEFVGWNAHLVTGPCGRFSVFRFQPFWFGTMRSRNNYKRQSKPTVGMILSMTNLGGVEAH
jgi:hypothetical protein